MTRTKKFIVSVIATVGVALLLSLLSAPVQGFLLNPSNDVEEAPVTSQAVVRIEAMDDGNSGHGSGVLISNDVVYTAAHVVKNVKKLRVIDSSGGISEVLSVRIFEGHDFAILILDKPSVVKTAKVTCDRLSQRDQLWIVGFPLNFSKLTFAVKVAGYRFDVGQPELLVTGVTLPGNSGGPAFDDKGRVVGVVHGEYNYTLPGPGKVGPVVIDTDLNILVPLSEIKEICGERTTS